MPPKGTKKAETATAAADSAAAAPEPLPVLPVDFACTPDPKVGGPGANFECKVGGAQFTIEVDASGFVAYNGQPATDYGNFPKSPQIFFTTEPGEPGVQHMKKVTNAIALMIKNQDGAYASIGPTLAKAFDNAYEGKVKPASAVSAFRKNFEFVASSGVKVTRVRLGGAKGAKDGDDTTLCTEPPNKVWMVGPDQKPVQASASGRGSPFFKKSIMGTVTLYPKIHFRQTGELFITWYLFQAVLYIPQSPVPVVDKRSPSPEPEVVEPVMSPRLMQNFKRFKPAAIDAPGGQAGGAAARNITDDADFDW